jgi:hypothetical protein
MAPHENQVVIHLTDPGWSFDRELPAYFVKHAGTWGRSELVDPHPAYAHDVDLVRTELAHLRAVAPLPFPLAIFVLGHETAGRTNGHYSEEHVYDEDRRNSTTVGLIVLSGKRIPIHPAMTRYLVAHEYGHAVEDHLARRRGMKDEQLKQLYRERVRPDASPDYGCGKWHANVGELFANDFRILIADREREFWPHAGFTRPEYIAAAWDFWRDAIAELRAPAEEAAA